MIRVVCVKQGRKYGPEWVNRLAAMVQRHLPLPHTFRCITDDPTGVNVLCEPIEYALPGWWSKLLVFRPRTQRTLYLDLDSIVVGDLSAIAQYGGNFAILRDFYRGGSHYGSGIMSLAPGDYGKEVWDRFTPEVMRQFRGDQDYLEIALPGADFWQDHYPGQICSYKVHVQKTGRVPANARVICFHGQPKNADLPKGDPLRQIWEQAA